MAVCSIVTFRISPGRMADWLANTATAKRTLERDGAKVRIWQAFTGNDPGLSATLVAEFDDMESYGRITEALSQDNDWRDFQQARQSGAGGGPGGAALLPLVPGHGRKGI